MDTQEIRDLVEDTTRHHGAPWKRVVSSDGSFYGVTDRNGAVVAGSPAVTALIAQAPTLIPELLDRLEQAELERDEWRGKFDEAETARIYSDAQVDRVREVLSEVQTRGESIRAKGNNGSIYHQERAARGEGYLEATRLAFRALDGDTRCLADQGLGGGQDG